MGRARVTAPRSRSVEAIHAEPPHPCCRHRAPQSFPGERVGQCSTQLGLRRVFPTCVFPGPSRCVLMVQEQRPIPSYVVSCGKTAARGLSPFLSEGHPPAVASTLCLVATDFLEMGHLVVCAAERVKK